MSSDPVAFSATASATSSDTAATSPLAMLGVSRSPSFPTVFYVSVLAVSGWSESDMRMSFCNVLAHIKMEQVMKEHHVPSISGASEPSPSGESDPLVSGVSEPSSSGESDPSDSGVSEPSPSGESAQFDSGVSDPSD